MQMTHIDCQPSPNCQTKSIGPWNDIKSIINVAKVEHHHTQLITTADIITPDPLNIQHHHTQHITYSTPSHPQPPQHSTTSHPTLHQLSSHHNFTTTQWILKFSTSNRSSFRGLSSQVRHTCGSPSLGWTSIQKHGFYPLFETQKWAPTPTYKYVKKVHQTYLPLYLKWLVPPRFFRSHHPGLCILTDHPNGKSVKVVNLQCR